MQGKLCSLIVLVQTEALKRSYFNTHTSASPQLPSSHPQPPTSKLPHQNVKSSSSLTVAASSSLSLSQRENGCARVPRAELSLRVSALRRETGTSMTRRRMMRLALRI